MAFRRAAKLYIDKWPLFAIGGGAVGGIYGMGVGIVGNITINNQKPETVPERAFAAVTGLAVGVTIGAFAGGGLWAGFPAGIPAVALGKLYLNTFPPPP